MRFRRRSSLPAGTLHPLLAVICEGDRLGNNRFDRGLVIGLARVREAGPADRCEAIARIPRVRVGPIAGEVTVQVVGQRRAVPAGNLLPDCGVGSEQCV